MLNPRKSLAAACICALVLTAGGLVSSSPAAAEPTVDDAEKKVDRLYHQAEQASERLNDARLELSALRKDLRALRADQGRQERRLDAARLDVQDSVLSQYEGVGVAAVGEVVVSDDPASFLAGMSTMSAFNDMQSEVFEDYDTELRALDLRSSDTQDRVDEMAAVKRRIAHEKETIDDRLREAKKVLADLEEEERRELLAASQSGTTTVVPTSVPASGRAAAAVSYALAQVGDAYVYGAAGPNAFDCSGLTMMSWAQAGVGLPHSSSAQMGSGPRVASSDLQPGDLVFYYSPVSHVGIYIGGGRIVHAANPGTGVVITGVFSMPYSGAVRPG